ncbi:hypothetical protein MTP04_15890 [Lysinibacillus sp. PLM2]|nr:hypothetical protein MTP04_15890 [Lysinibacillus sp. PLM2]
MKSKWLFSVLIFVVILSGCGTKTNGNSVPSEKYEYENIVESTAESDDFLFKLTSKKPIYQVGEPLEIKAELTYKGDEETLKIAHAASPIWLFTTNLTEDYQFEAAMNEPLIITQLLKNEPYVEQYSFTGGSYFEGAPGNPYNDDVLMKMGKGEFPPGQYEIKGRTDFAVGEDITGDKINLETSIIFTVIE